MGLKIIYLIATVSLIASCTKTSIPETTGDSHEIVVSIADTQIDTKSIVNIVEYRGKTSFSPGDQLLLHDSLETKAFYIYKSKRSGDDGEEYVFHNRDLRASPAIDTTKIVVALYPASWFQGYTFKPKTKKKYVTVKFPEEQSYAQHNEKQNISAPMVCFTPNNSKLNFSNLSCLLRIGIKCDYEPESDIFVSHINVISDLENSLNGNFTFGSDGSLSVALGDSYLSLIDCENAGVLSRDVKYFYIILPPICNLPVYEADDKYTVDVYFVGGKSKSYSFTVTEGGDTQITKNTILDFPPITINPSDLL